MSKLLPRPSPSWIANLLSEAKGAYDAGQFKEAARAYATLANVFDGWSEQRDEALPVMLPLLADSQRKAGDPKRAARTYARLGAFLDSAGDRRNAEFNWEAAARSSIDANQFGEAERCARNAVEAGRAAGDALITARSMAVLAQTLWRNNEAPAAADVSREAVDLVPSKGDDATWIRYECFELLARISLSAEEWPAAQNWSQELVATMEVLPDPDGRWRGRVDNLLTEIHERLPTVGPAGSARRPKRS